VLPCTPPFTMRRRPTPRLIIFFAHVIYTVIHRRRAIAHDRSWVVGWHKAGRWCDRARTSWTGGSPCDIRVNWIWWDGMRGRVHVGRRVRVLWWWWLHSRWWWWWLLGMLLWVCRPRMGSRHGLFALCSAGTGGRRKVRLDAHSNDFLASLSKELVLLTTEIQASGTLFEEERLLWWLRRE